MQKVFAFLAGLAGVMTIADIASAATVYRQNFSATAGMTPLSAVGWTAYYGNAITPAALAIPGNNGSPANAMLSAGPSAPTAGGNVDATAVANATSGFVPLLSADGIQQLLAYTTEYAVDPTVATPTFSWYEGSAYIGDSQRLAIQISGQWYASTAVFSPTAGAITGTQFQSVAKQATVTFSTAADGWQALNFLPGSPMTLGGNVSLPSGTISAFGVYATIADAAGSTAEKTYIDTFEVSTPEPTLGMAGLTLGTLLLRHSRPRRES